MILDTVKSLCESRKITIAELERKMHSGNGTIRRWSVASPSAKKLSEIADYFGVSTDFLLGRSTISAKSQAIANQVEKLPVEKQELVKRYIEVIQKE